MRMPSKHHRAGYTLLEMIAVLVIVVILAALTIPMIQTTLMLSRIDAWSAEVDAKVPRYKLEAS